MIFKLPQLNYSYSDLEPYIDTKTMEIHHGKHHQSYIDNLNKAIEGVKGFEKLNVSQILTMVEKLPEDRKQPVINNAGGHANHSFFWEIMSPKKSKIGKELDQALVTNFGSVESFKEKFIQKALDTFGSGWTFLILDNNKKLQLKRHSFQNSPFMYNTVPLLGVDLWEHAYYLKYQNRKKDYLEAWWNIINWEKVNNNFKSSFNI